ncbi:MAG: C_GCAxxG_C_C family protein [Candidatus Thorarchaeota archaeon]|nr:MAG: C_GCAxxG_C_C family protein [Candidatus Thorarchaeota archaeon]
MQANIMEEDNGRSFNCAESVLIGINRESPIPGFTSSCMKIASVLGGGVAGFREICGAVSGGVVCLGLLLGTSGDEDVETFNSQRTNTREIVKAYLQEFADCWGSVQCGYLLEMDEGKRTPTGTLRSDGPPKKLCDEYVDWTVKKIAEIRMHLE